MKNTIKLIFFILFPILCFSQNSLRGTIIDEKGQPIEGANVKVKNTQRITISDSKGNFTLNLQKGKNVLVASFVGYETTETIIENQKEITIMLPKKDETLKEVVIIGYGEVNKKDVTGSITSIKPTDDNVNQAQGVENLIQGRAAGVLVSSQGFEPGSPMSLQIRGINSLTSNTQPLYVVDGIIVNSASEDAADPLSGGNSYLSPQGGLNGINPRDIESIEILKDASATAIYGSRGSNGVVLITTKKGKAGKTKFNYNANTKIGTISKSIDVLNGAEYAAYQNKGRELRGFAPNYTISADGVVTDLNNLVLTPINWNNDIYKPTVSYNHRISISGGNDNNTFYFAIGHANSDGLVQRTFSKQTDFNLNLTNKLSARLKLSSKIGVTFSKNFGSKGTENLGGASNSIVRQVISAAPFSDFSANYFGDTTDNIDSSIDGPRAWVKDYDDESDELRGLGSFNLEYKISDVFKYKVLVGLDYRKKDRQIWYGTSIQRGALANGEAGLSQLTRFRYNIDNTILFNKKFSNKHRIDGTLGFVIDQVNSKQVSYQASDFPIKDLRADGISTGEVFQQLVYDKIPESLMSFLGRFNYTFHNRYNFTASFRADGSSKFSNENRFSYFPAFAFAWQMNKEPFLKNYSKLSEAKLRLGWGLTGNQGIRPYQTLTPYGPTANLYSDASGNGVTALIPTNLANPNLKWETTSQYNAGLDLGFLDKRLSFTFDVFYKKTYDLLQYLSIGPSTGFSSITANQGDLENRGFEVSFSADIVKTKDFTWNVFGNFSKYKNKIIGLDLPPSQFGSNTYSAFLGNQISGGNIFKVPANIFIEGQEAALFWGYQTNGIINNADELANAPTFNGAAPQLGDVLLVDQNGDNVIDEKDNTVIGNPNPDFNYGFGTNFTYKQFSLNIFFNGLYGNDIANGNLLRENYANGISPDNIRPEAYHNAWSVDNPNGTFPRVNYDLVEETGFTDRIIEDGSFLRLSNVTFGYRLELSKSSPVDSVDFAFAANNLLLFTKYSGYDPEVNSFSFDPLRKGVDWQSFPNQRSFSFSVNVSF